jgi:DNA ligase-1
VSLATARRVLLFLGDLAAVARVARSEGPAALERLEPRLFVPLSPMLAELATDVEQVLIAHQGRTALEFKYDGARIQLHADGARVAIWSRGLADVTASLPDVVAVAQREITGAPVVLDGEVVARDAAGRPLPFQELMRRFRRVRGVGALAEAVPLSIHFFDCLVAEGRSLIDRPAEERWDALQRVTGGRHLAERLLATTHEAARAFERQALEAGHEGPWPRTRGAATSRAGEASGGSS